MFVGARGMEGRLPSFPPLWLLVAATVQLTTASLFAEETAFFHLLIESRKSCLLDDRSSDT